MEIGSTLVGRVLGWIPAPWSGVRLGSEASARVCTYGHPMVFSIGGPPPPRGPLHADLRLKLWIRSGPRTTVRGIEAAAAGQALVPRNFKEMTLEPGGAPEKDTIRINPPKGEALAARAGERVEVKLLLTQGRTHKLKLTLEPEG
jgi:hypothetical protein